MSEKKPNDYKMYGYDDAVPFKSKCENMKEYFDEKFAGVNDVDEATIRNTIHSSVSESMCGVNHQLHGIRHDIHCSTHTIVDEIHAHSGDCGDCCNERMAAKIDEAVERVNAHTDERFNGINFEQKFSDLNDQAEEIIRRLGN